MLFLGQEYCFLGKKCTITWQMLHIVWVRVWKKRSVSVLLLKALKETCYIMVEKIWCWFKLFVSTFWSTETPSCNSKNNFALFWWFHWLGILHLDLGQIYGHVVTTTRQSNHTPFANISIFWRMSVRRRQWIVSIFWPAWNKDAMQREMLSTEKYDICQLG